MTDERSPTTRRVEKLRKRHGRGHPLSLSSCCAGVTWPIGLIAVAAVSQLVFAEKARSLGMSVCVGVRHEAPPSWRTWFIVSIGWRRPPWPSDSFAQA